MINKIFLILLFFSCFLLIEAQHPINGVYEFNSYRTQSGFQGFYKYDFNIDGKPDLMLIGKDDKKVVWLKLNSDGTVEEIINKFFFYPISNLKKFKLIEGSGETHLFTSRQERMLGLVSFTKYGTIQLLNEIRFDSYPSGILTDDFNRDHKEDALVFGNSFNGISLIEEFNYKLTENKLIEEGIFSELTVVDLNTDGYKDFVAFNTLDNSLHFFENSDTAAFDEIRKVNLEYPIKNLSSIYFNNDQYVDLIYNNANNLFVLWGDSVSSYKNKSEISLDSELINYSYGDFNGDNKNDLSLLTNDGVYLSYTSDFESFTKPFIIDKINNPSAIINAGFNSFFYYSNNGELRSLKYSNKTKTNQKLKLSINNNSLKTFTVEGSLCFSFIDSVKSKLVIVKDFLSDKSYINEINVQNCNINNIIPVSHQNATDFYLISKDKSLMEVISQDFSDYSVTKTNLVLGGEILTCYKDSTKEEMTFVHKNDSTIRYTNIDIESDERVFVEKTFNINDSLNYIVTKSGVLSIEESKDTLKLFDMDTSEEKMIIEGTKFKQSISLPYGISLIYDNPKLIIFHNDRFSETLIDSSSFNFNGVKVLDSKRLATINQKNNELIIIDLSRDYPVITKHKIILEKDFNISDFQVIKTLLIFTASDGTINIQELI